MEKRTGVVDVLGIVFVVLRLCNVITWPWIWVLAPFWGQIPLLILLGIWAMK